MQKVAVEVIGAQALQRLLAMTDGAFTARVAGDHLRDQKDFFAPPLDRLPDQGLGFAGAVELGGIYVREAQVERRPNRSDRSFRIALFEVPRAEPNFGNLHLRGTEDVPRKLPARHWRTLARPLPPG
jgi:hypothetical protein